VILVMQTFCCTPEDQLNPQHEIAREWWDAQLSGVSPVCLCLDRLCAFIRISTNRRVFERPLTLKSSDCPRAELACSTVHTTDLPHRATLDRVSTLVIEGQALGNLVSDAHLAALAVQHGCELMSTG